MPCQVFGDQGCLSQSCGLLGKFRQNITGSESGKW